MIIALLVILMILFTVLNVNAILGTRIQVTAQQAELIEWCTNQMLKLTDASMTEALNICTKYYLKQE